MKVFKQTLRREDFREFAQNHEDKLDKLAMYVAEQHTSFYSYKDYYHACIKLGVEDMLLDKNLFPHDFQRWHDIRFADIRHYKKNKYNYLTRRIHT